MLHGQWCKPLFPKPIRIFTSKVPFWMKNKNSEWEINLETIIDLKAGYFNDFCNNIGHI
jgi:hypothetical protein